jgi:hypothetical protein
LVEPAALYLSTDTRAGVHHGASQDNEDEHTTTTSSSTERTTGNAVGSTGQPVAIVGARVHAW